MPSDDSNVRSDHGHPAQRVCVLGNSFIGAIKRAYADNGAPGYEFSFFGGGGKNFTKLNIDGTSIAGVTHHDGVSRDIRDYDIFIIYGVFPTPVRLVETLEIYRLQKYSQQYMELISQEQVSRYPSSRLCSQLLKAGASKVFMLSKNFYVSENVGTSLQNDEGTKLIRKFINPAIYIPHPEVITSRDGRPPAQYYKGYQSVESIEESAGSADQQSESIEELDPAQKHFNPVGGAIMLSTIVDFLNSVLAPDFVGGPAQCSARESGGSATIR